MKRREFITLIGGGAAAWPLAARAQQPARTRKVGLLHPGESTTVSARVAAIREGLNGPDNQRNSGIELVIRLADGDLSRLPALAKDLVNNRVDAIVAVAPAAVHAAAGATTSIPVIAIDLETDPVGSGLVASLARPGRNVSGVFLDFPEFSAKCLQLLIESVPTLKGLGVLWDPSTGSLQLKAVEAAAQGFGISARVFETRRAADIADAFYAIDRSRIQGVDCRVTTNDRGPRDAKKYSDDRTVPRYRESGRAARLRAGYTGSFSPSRSHDAQGALRR
jgi:putative tryptophan/tyrosine transport system substrate-binding protein